MTKDILKNYFHCDISEYSFQDLNDLVIDKNNCILCGTCMSICPRICLNQNRPSLQDYDPECSLCFKYCAKTFFPEKLFQEEIFPQNCYKDPSIGYYQKIIAAKAADETILKIGQNGGTVTSLLIHALNKGIIDGALITGKDENWKPKPIIATTSKEILEAAGSVYALAPTLLGYNEILYKYKLKKLAFVGMPCQIQAVRKLQYFPPLSNEYGKFILIIGLFCTSNYSYDSMKEIIEKDCNVPINEVKKVDITGGKIIIYTVSEKIKEISLNKIKKYSWPSCQYCKDYTAEYSDISIGSIGAQDGKWNTIIIRSDIGMDLFNEALKSKRIINSNKIDISKINSEALKKKLKIVNVNDKVLSSLKMFDISELAAEIYTILLSLENANISILTTIMKKQTKEIERALSILQHRNWISLKNGYYKPMNPVKVFKEEINQLKKKFNNDLMNFKLDAFKTLETIYIQNNLKYVKDNEFIEDFF
ncbi:MAG: Coenzyme F420 hydrogenase/dehydrogenase, beta subunit C-terminal domain [Candidatus Thorarchaeota archaeon]